MNDTSRELIRRVRSASRALGRAKRLYREMDGHPEHPGWARLLAQKPKNERGDDEWWMETCWKWIVPNARDDLDEAKDALVRHVLRGDL